MAHEPAAAGSVSQKLESRGRAMSLVRDFFSRPLGVIGLVIIVVIVFSAILAPWITPYGVNEQSFDGLSDMGAPLPPGGEYIIGTDLLGRDLLTRILYGARVSLIIGLIANGISIVFGSCIGLFAGYYRGWVESLLMRFTDVIMAFPALVLGICLAAVLSPSFWLVAVVIALVNWGQVARVIFNEASSLSKRDFVLAERAIGAKNSRIILKHILPHLVPTILVYGTLGISVTVLLEATLSYLGVGVQPPRPSWGVIIFET